MVRDRSLVTSLRRARALGAAPDPGRARRRRRRRRRGRHHRPAPAALRRRAEQPVEVCLVEREARLGPGLAYRHDHPRHTAQQLRRPAQRRRRRPRPPGPLVPPAGYDVGPTDFLPRTLYGALPHRPGRAPPRVPPGSALSRVRGVGARRRARGRRGARAPDRRLERDRRRRRARARQPAAAAPHAVRRRTPATCPTRGPPTWPSRSGSRPRCCSSAAGSPPSTWSRCSTTRTPMSRFTLVSRHGLLPRTHRRDPSPMRQTVDVPAGPLDSLVAQVRALVDADGRRRRRTGATSSTPLRASANRLWRGARRGGAGRLRARPRPGVGGGPAPDAAPPGGASCASSMSAGRLVVRTPAEVDPADFDRRRQLQRARPRSPPAAGTRSSTRCWTAARSGPTASGLGARPRPAPAGSSTPPARRCPTSSPWGRPDAGSTGRSPRCPTCGPRPLEVAEEILPALRRARRPGPAPPDPDVRLIARATGVAAVAGVRGRRRP